MSQSRIPRCSRRHAAPSPVGPGPMIRCRTFTRGLWAAPMEDERIAEGCVRLVLHGIAFWMRREELGECARLSLSGVAAVVEPVVEQQHCAILQERRNRGQRIA